MDFLKLKSEAQKLTKSAKQVGKSMVDFSTQKLGDSSFSLQSIKEIESFIEKSKNTRLKDADGKDKEQVKRVIILFCDKESELFKKMLYLLPVLATKAFSQNISIKLADSNIENLKKSDYNISAFPGLVVFENAKGVKTVEGEEKILKIVKDASLDINTTINNIK